jgi:hypothetical protein
MVTIKLPLNSVISTKGAHYCTVDLKDFFLNTPMIRPEYMRMKLKDIPPKFDKIYNLKKIVAPDGLHQDPEGRVRPPTGWHPCLEST